MIKPNSRPQLADTVVGAFSDEELSSRMSVMSVKGKRPSEPKGFLRKTVVGRFSDLTEQDLAPPAAQKKPVRKLPSILTDTVIQSSSDEEDSAGGVAQKQNIFPSVGKHRSVRPSLPDTIIGFSDTMSGFSAPVREPQPEAIEEVEEVGSVEESESEYDQDVITVLDSDEEHEVAADDEPPVLDTAESFHNCSSNGICVSVKATDSDTTVNKFFNNPPLITNPERVVTHSVIRMFREGQFEKVEEEQPKRTVADESIDRLKVPDDGDDQDLSFEAENIVLAETDVSDLQQSIDINKAPVSEEINIQESSEPTEEHANVETSASSEDQFTTQPTDSSVAQSTQNLTIVEKINISANININLKFSVRSSSRSSGSSESSDPSSSDTQPPSPKKQTPRQAPRTTPGNSNQTPRGATPRQETPKAGPSKKKALSIRKEKQAPTAGSGRKSNLKDLKNPALLHPAANNNDNLKQLTLNDEFSSVIDPDLQEALSSVYGDSWKTPELLKSCKSKSDRQNLRKSIHANNFDSCKSLQFFRCSKF